MCKGLSQLPATCLKGAKDIKHKLSHLLQKPEPRGPEPRGPEPRGPEPQGPEPRGPEPRAADAKASKDRASAAPDKTTPSAADVQKWRKSFINLVKSDVGRSVFSTFLRSEFSEENLKFWEACEEYKRSPPSQLQTRAKQIYQRFIEADAPNEVNLDAATRDLTRQNLEQACPSCFDEAQRMIHILMEKDPYRRFLSSALLQELCQQGGAAERAGGA